MAGLASYIKWNTNWRLISLDDLTVISGQFAPTEVTEQYGARYASEDTLSRGQPIIQWDGDEVHEISFIARVWIHNELNFSPLDLVATGGRSLYDLMDEIKATVRPDPTLRRPRVFSLKIGGIKGLSMDSCVVRNVGPIAYDRFLPTNGARRGATFSIRCQAYDPYNISLEGSGAPAESLVKPLYPGESFEQLAARVYGDPNLGEALRRRHPEYAIPVGGERIHLPPVDRLAAGFLRTPRHPVLARGNGPALEVRNAHFERVGRVRRSFRLTE